MGHFLYNNTEHNIMNTIPTQGSISEPDYLRKAIYSLIIFICIPGIVGNGIVIRLLHFQTKRHPFAHYILNLAVADTGTLLFVFISAIRHLTTEDSCIEIIEVLLCTYCTGQFLLTIISIDRCLAVFFPIWHRCHQPPHLSTLLCVFSWIVSILFCTIHYTLIRVTDLPKHLQYFLILIFTSICIPVIVISSLALFIKGYLKLQMKKRGKLLKAILLALFFFLIFSIPPSAIYLNDIISQKKKFNFIPYGYLCACLNSSVNPLIYFLLGRRKERHSRYNLKISLQRVFKEEEEESSEPPDIQAEE
ncbi:mas-related G-protein coupled receptor member H-like [Thamnophis elegans]|uniref:mas-related G-protein coupled receptor member H-like n=1 Tax=Thamnophis elegans TaxID=35005 RepID=UPI001377F4D4|nr:mas-related G-protein coupled receptor member H-like [Thamnophis elegans]